MAEISKVQGLKVTVRTPRQQVSPALVEPPRPHLGLPARPPRLDRRLRMEAASLSAEVSEAKAVTEGDPTNTVKVLKTPSRLQPPTIQSDRGRRSPTPTSAHTSRGGLGTSIKWTSSGIVQALDAYYEAAAAFDRDFGHKYEATEESLRTVHTVVGHRAFSTSLQNPFPEHDLRRVTFDNKLRDRVVSTHAALRIHLRPLYTTHDSLGVPQPLVWQNLSASSVFASIASVHFALQSLTNSFSLALIDTMWFEELEAMEAGPGRGSPGAAPAISGAQKLQSFGGIGQKTLCLGMPLRFSDKEVNLLRDDVAPAARTRCQSIALRTYARTAPDPSPAQTPQTPQTPRGRDVPSNASPYISEYHPSPNKQKARVQGPPLRQQQWRNWTYNVLPKLVPVFPAPLA
ncbi:hypothetical protein B0H14DRAFT_2619145 [Mycena olivaceomarginata]|nr:hypothetical protein B0H14DRAFT_2619145 [Mycena olivaceomarginata]